MTQFPFWPVFWLIWVLLQFLWRKQETWEYMEQARIKQFWVENRDLQLQRALTENSLVILGALALTHTLALLCRFVVQ